MNDSSNALHDDIRRDLGPLLKAVGADRVTGVCIIGSASFPELWRPGVSDIDICLFVPRETSLPELAIRLRRDLRADAMLLLPHVVSDVHSQRVETVIEISARVYDLTFLTGEVTVGQTWKEIRYDWFELYAGSVLRHAVWLEGQPPSFLPPPISRLLPYYDEEVRSMRLTTLTEGLRRELAAVSGTMHDSRYVPRLCELQTVFLQALFISKRFYPLSYRKHLEFQFRRFLGLEPDILLYPDNVLSDPARISERWLCLLI